MRGRRNGQRRGGGKRKERNGGTRGECTEKQRGKKQTLKRQTDGKGEVDRKGRRFADEAFGV